MAGFAENQGARIFHLMMIFPAGALLLIFSLVSLSTLAVINRQFTDEYEDRNYRQEDRVKCILYAKEGERRLPEFSESTQCEFAVAGGGILSIISVIFIGILVAKAIFGVGV